MAGVAHPASNDADPFLAVPGSLRPAVDDQTPTGATLGACLPVPPGSHGVARAAKPPPCHFTIHIPSRGFTTSSGSGFRYSQGPDHRFGPRFQHLVTCALLHASCPISHASLSPVPPGSQRVQRFPSYPATTANTPAADLLVLPSHTLTRLLGFSAARFQSRSLTRQDRSTIYRLPEGNG